MEKKQMNILFGFKSAGTQQKILTYLTCLGCDVHSNARYSKPLILDYVRHNKNCDTVILKEYLDGGGKYEADEIAELTEEADVNVVIVLDSYHRGREYMKILLDAGITGAVFPEYKDSVNPEELAKLAYRKRCRKEARYYYRIQNLKVDMGTLNYEQFSEYYQYLTDENYGVNGTDRFMTIMQWLTPARASYFIKNLPEEMLTQLSMTSEFYDVLDELKKKRYYPLSNSGKRPKKLVRGIPEDSFRKKTVEQFGPPPDITVRTMSAVRNTENGEFEEAPLQEEVTLAKTEYEVQEEVAYETDVPDAQPDRQMEPKQLKEFASLISGMNIEEISKIMVQP